MDVLAVELFYVVAIVFEKRQNEYHMAQCPNALMGALGVVESHLLGILR